LQWAVTFVVTRPFFKLRLFAAAPFTDPQVDTIRGIAEVVLPTALGRQDREQVVGRFVAWFTNYRAGADMGHSYGGGSGFRLPNPSGPSPASRYAPQFTALDAAAHAKGAASFAAAPLGDRRAIVEATLSASQNGRLSARPNGNSLILDVMGFYFSSADAFDLCYNADIGRETCRGLPGSDRAPASRGGR